MATPFSEGFILLYIVVHYYQINTCGLVLFTKGPYWVGSAEEEFVDQINQSRHTQHDIVDLDLSLVVVFHLQQLV